MFKVHINTKTLFIDDRLSSFAYEDFYYMLVAYVYMHTCYLPQLVHISCTYILWLLLYMISIDMFTMNICI